MGQVKEAANSDKLVLRLDEPGMTSMLRAGLGGLAASLYALSWPARNHDWHQRIALGPGYAIVEPRQITLVWGDSGPEPVIRALFAASFKIREGVIYLPGMFDPAKPFDLSLVVAVQNALKLTFLQHGKSTKKAGEPVVKTVQPDDDKTVLVSVQPYAGFAHQEAWQDAITSFKTGVQLAGWANPGAVGRHNAYSDTELTYSPSQTIATLFSIVGCVSYQVSGDAAAGALVVPVPMDLVAFARARSRMLARPSDVHVAGTSDAVLSASLALEADKHEHRSIARMEGVTLRATAWASQQKSRVQTMRLLNDSDKQYETMLEVYREVRHTLKTRIIERKAPPKEAKRGAKKNDVPQEALGYFASVSALRGFIAENLAAGNRWYQGFATAKVGVKKPRYLHQYRQQDNLGALFPWEKEGLWTMIEKTPDPDKILVVSIHTALRQRFGAIWDETKNLPKQTRDNRLQGERERWRLAFAKAKTADQTRGALADLWSRAGTNKELREHWKDILPLLKSNEWARVRDLALVALASYRSKNEEESEETPVDDSTDEGT